MKMDDFILIEVEKLSLKDEFMQWQPQTWMEKKTKELITEAIHSGVKNFYRPKYDPSFTSDEKNIRFVPGTFPAVGKSYNWWKKVAKEYCPKRNSRLGTRLEYAAFMGVLIKKLVEEGKSIKWAWNAVCNNSKELGHYWNSPKANHKYFELIGKRCVCGFYDLANTYKILVKDVESSISCLAGGCYLSFSYDTPIAGLDYATYLNGILNWSVGWIVLEK